MKADFEVMDTLIYSIPDVLSDVKEELNRAVFEIHLLRLQYEQLKKEYKESEKADMRGGCDE
jgi:regulator of replication initiation timing